MTTNFQLEEMVKNLGIEHFKGVFSRDELASELTGTTIGPSDVVLSEECGILNLDSKSGPGTHWTAYYRKDKCNYYFSSFGDDPPNELVKYLEGDILTHTFCIQDFDDTNCGEFSVLFLYLMSRAREGKYDYYDVILFMNSF
jgi:hypothetical protein